MNNYEEDFGGKKPKVSGLQKVTVLIPKFELTGS